MYDCIESIKIYKKLNCYILTWYDHNQIEGVDEWIWRLCGYKTSKTKVYDLDCMF